MGEYRAKLISAYSEFIISKKSFDRKSKLYKDKIISENDYLNVKSAYDKAKAEYYSIRDTIAYEVKQKLFELEQSHKIDEFRMYTSEQNLRILGLTTNDIAQLNISGAVYQKECVDNSCIYNEKNAKHFHTNEEMLSHIEIKAKCSGTLIKRNIELGEEADSNKTIFTVADLDTVYADLQASSKDISSLKVGQKVTIISDEEDKTIGKIIMVSPIISEETRTAIVRVIIDNHDNRFRPGSFVVGKIEISAENLPIVLPKEAVQNIKGSNIVFVESDEGFKPVDVIIGREDSKNIEIIKGIKAGTKYVSQGAFTLKSIVVTSGIDPHAGHGH
jgi:cobalt-zinc-cadmium efflux system membrane fusion protein